MLFLPDKLKYILINKLTDKKENRKNTKTNVKKTVFSILTPAYKKQATSYRNG